MQTDINLPKFMRPKQFFEALGLNRYMKEKLMKEFKGNEKILRGQTGIGRRPMLYTKEALRYIEKLHFL